MKRCIFHYPAPIADAPGIGSALRPKRMLAAFRAIGYEVEEVTGYSRERKEKIAAVRRKIQSGTEYDFVYSESVNDPTAMTDRDHIPRHPFMDFSFLALCKKSGIPTGLFYRDMHWRFPFYRDSVSWWKRAILVPMFRRDLRSYRRVLSLIYFPSEAIHNYVMEGFPFRTLPPGGKLQEETLTRKRERRPVPGELHVFYVGSITGGVYDVRNLCAAVKDTAGVYLTICTPQAQWETAREQYAPVLCDRVRVVHRSSDQLAELYEQADVFACCLQSNEYTDLAMPIKVPESICYGTPVMITETIAAADLIRQEGCGWPVAGSDRAMAELLAFLRDHPEEVAAKTRNTVDASPRHTWEARARQVAEDLTNLHKE